MWGIKKINFPQRGREVVHLIAHLLLSKYREALPRLFIYICALYQGICIHN